MSAENITTIFLLFLLLKYGIYIYLTLRNRKSIIDNKDSVPEMFKDSIPLEDHNKAANYNKTKIDHGMIFLILNVLILLGWTLGGWLNMLDSSISSFDLTPINRGILFFILFGILSTLIGLPESIHTTFVIEQRFGFNKTTPKVFIIDMFKALALSFVIGIPLLYTLLWFMEKTGNMWWVYASTAVIIFQFFIMWLYPSVIAPLFNKFSPLDNSELKEEIDSLIKQTGFPGKEILVMDGSKRSSHGNAYFAGFGKKKRIVFYDTLINTLTIKEVKAVLAHEIGHYKKKHILKHMLISILFTFISFYILGVLYNSEVFFQGHGVEILSSYMALLLFSLVAGVYTFFISPLMGILSRKHEFEADRFAAEYAKSEDLISSLIKMYKDNASTLTPDPLYSAFFHSHPPASIRISALKKLSNSQMTT